jgi:hypothetical protein
LAVASDLPVTRGVTHETVGGGGATWSNVAVVVFAASIVREHVPEPLQAPDQPENVEPAAAVAVNVTTALSAKSCEHVEPHSIPTGLDVTVPAPVPAPATVRLFVLGGTTTGVKVAVAEWF